jgi:hypothetical protein
MRESQKLKTDAFESALEIIERYMRGRCEPGSGIQAVLEGNLYEAVRRVDVPTRECLGELAHWIATHLPGDVYGSREKVQAWLHPAPPAEPKPKMSDLKWH